MGRMWPPHSVQTCPTPACLSVRATRWPPVRSLMSVTPCARHVGHLELQAIRVLEEDGVIARPVCREVARCAVERGQSAGEEELLPESIHVVPSRHPERQVVDAGALSVKTWPRVRGVRGDEPEV